MDVKVGDTFCATWGYEQTNVDFYKVVRVLKKMVEIQEIGCKRVGEATGWASDRVQADASVEVGEPFKRVPKFYGQGECYLSINSVATASRVSPGHTAHRSWYA